ncbi:solute carrier family 22 member 3-like isoform X2 [Eriocheir sinensis]|uniref:solute carrier family 22 member 3-like isoform X2 n=1 Tax=Eriocheir sinensis TaxID=95602 RepID=UPI0021C9EF5D|nr:solute carrier family 22 member 3-like isoform X2 [Eriocheir sinensis]
MALAPLLDGGQGAKKEEEEKAKEQGEREGVKEDDMDEEEKEAIRGNEKEERLREEEDKDEDEEEEEEDLLEIAGARGKWTSRAILLCAAVTFVVPLQAMSYQVLGGTPQHWCQPAALAAADWTPQQVYALVVPENLTEGDKGCLMYDYNYTLAASLDFEEAMANTTRLHTGARTITTCTSRYFNASHSTTVTEWDLVCERRALYSTTFSVSHILRVFSCLMQGLVIDAFGRSRCALVCAALFVSCSMAASFAASLQVYLALRGLVAVFEHFLYVACFVLTLELCTPKQRSLAGNLFAVPYALGYMFLPGLALLVKDWRNLQLALSLPGLALISYYWLLPESPRWLATQGRLKEAQKVLCKAALVNGNPAPPRTRLMTALAAIHAKTKEEARSSGRQESDVGSSKDCINLTIKMVQKLWLGCCEVGRSVRALVSTARLAIVTAIVFYIWFTASSTYYGISLYSVNLSTNQYLYLFLGGLLELPAYVLLWPLVSRFGRKKTNAGLYLTCGLSLTSLLLLQGLAPQGPVWVLVAFSLF